MFATNSSIQRSFYPQTGDFQFGIDISLSGNTGILNCGVYGPSNGINFLLSGSKIIDNDGKFLSTYTPNNIVTLSGNLTSTNYDIFINDTPFSYGINKNTGIYNYFYISPQNISCSYNLFLNGELPNLFVSSVNCYTGTTIAAGNIINLSPLPVRLYSGMFTNLSSNLPFSLSGLFTGDLHNTGNFYILPSGNLSAGNYTGNLQLTTNGGILSYQIQINITGSPTVNSNSISINGLNRIGANSSQKYNASIIASSGIPILISLSHVSGSGNYYQNIDVTTGITTNISSFIFNTGIVSQFLTGIGTGQGGLLNNFTTGFSSGTITGNFQFATGNNFIWNTSVNISGYGTGNNYSGIGTGTYLYPSTGSISDGSGTYYYNDQVIVNSSNLYSLNPTGYIHGTGKIFYNTPTSFDKLYINDNNFAIVYPFTYSSFSGLISYINSNTGMHLVTAVSNSVNTITLSGIYGTKTNVGMHLDAANIGSMALSTAILIGGKDLGIGQKLVGSSLSTGNINTTFTGSGFYPQTSSGYIYGSGNLLSYIKTFTGSWDIATGNLFSQVDYLNNLYYDASKDTYKNNLPVNYNNSTANITINYNNNDDLLNDVAQIAVSGLNTNTVSFLTITGVPR